MSSARDPRVIRVTQEPTSWGTVNPADVAHLSGLDFFEGWASGRYPSPTIGRTLNFRLVEAAWGRAVFEGQPTAEFYNPIGSVHGSYAAALLDSCMGCAVHASLAAGQAYTTLEYKISLVRGMSDKTGVVRAEGTILQVGRRVASAEGRLTDGNGRLLAHGTTTCLVFEV
jgi:uncharacterized protein (TIGR00369 family)